MKKLFALFVGVLLIIPVATSALTEAELQQQIADLLARIAALQSQVGSTGTTQPTTNPYPPSTGAQGAVFNGGLSLSRYIERGMSGEDVSRLQSFLAQDSSVYPEAQITGFYGPLTERAVQRFQVACGVVSTGDYESTGYGRVGPRTRAALLNGCSGSAGSVPSEVGAVLRITPITGNAPLTVQAEATVNTTRSCEAGTYLMDFGDGSAPTPIYVQQGRCAEVAQVVPHTYNAPGDYIARLYIGSHSTTVRVTVTGGTTVYPGTGISTYAQCVASGGVILQSYPAQCRLSTGQIFVQDYVSPTLPTANRLAVTPASGNAPLAVAAQFQIRPGDPYTVDWGDGTASTISGSFTERQQLPLGSTVFTQGLQDVVLQHTYTSGGTKNVVLRLGQYEAEGQYYVWRTRFYTKNVIVNGGSTTGTQGDVFTPNITSGDAPLTVTFNVTINGSGSCNGGTYTIEFGDGEKSALQFPADSCAPQTYVVTHRYVAVGNYTAKLHNFPENLIGSNTAVKSVSITVGGSSTGSGSPVPFSITPGIDGNGFKVRTDFTLLHTCVPFTLDWGDGSSVITRDAGTANCSAVTDQKSYTHTYSAAGSYTITLKHSSPQVTQSAGISISN